MGKAYSSLEEAGIKEPIDTGRHIVRLRCPICSDNRRHNPHAKCLTLWPNGNDSAIVNWHCHHCGEGGFVPRNQPEKRIEIEDDTSEASDGVRNFMRKRGISADTLNRAGVRRSERSDGGYIAFRYYMNGELMNIKYRSKGKKFRLSKGGKLVFYGIDDIAGVDTAIICEGEIDKLSFDEAGFTNSVSVPNGAPGEKAQVVRMDYLDLCIDYFDEESVTKIILALDNDGPGKRLEREFMRRFGAARCWTVEYPAGCKDANEVLIKHGKEGVKALIDNAKPVPCPNVYDESTISDSLQHLYDNGYPEGCRTGLKGLDMLFKWYVPALTVVTGSPGSGKSNWLDMCFVSLAKNEGWKFLVYSPENYPIEAHSKRLSTQYIGRPLLGEGRMSQEQLDESKAFINKHFTFIDPDAKGSHLLETIMDVAALSVKRNGVNCLLIDPWNMIESDLSKEPETIYIQKTLKKLKDFARSLNIMVVIVAHPRKHSNGIPTLYDIAGSANWFNMADNGFVINRSKDETEDDRDITTVYVSKVKHTYMGRTGECKLVFDRLTQAYHDFDTGFIGEVNRNLNVDSKRVDSKTNEAIEVKESEWSECPF